MMNTRQLLLDEQDVDAIRRVYGIDPQETDLTAVNVEFDVTFKGDYLPATQQDPECFPDPVVTILSIYGDGWCDTKLVLRATATEFLEEAVMDNFCAYYKDYC